MKKIYKTIAKEHGVSAAEVRRNIQAAIDEAYKNPNWYARRVPREGVQPTPEELIAHIAKNFTRPY